MFRRKPAPPPEGPRRPGPRPRRRSVWLYAFALIGILAVLFLVIRFLIIPLLVLAA